MMRRRWRRRKWKKRIFTIEIRILTSVQLTDLREHLEGQDSKFEQMESQLLLGCAEGHPLQNGVSRGTNASQLLAVPTSDYIQTRRRSRDLTSRPRASPSPSVRRESLRERPNPQWRSSHGSQDAWLTIPQNVNTEETFLTTPRRPRSRALSVDVSPGSARKLSTGSSRFSYRDRTRKDSSNYSNGTANNQLYVSAMRKDSVQESSTCKIMWPAHDWPTFFASRLSLFLRSCSIKKGTGQKVRNSLQRGQVDASCTCSCLVFHSAPLCVPSCCSFAKTNLPDCVRGQVF